MLFENLPIDLIKFEYCEKAKKSLKPFFYLESKIPNSPILQKTNEIMYIFLP